MFFVLKTIFFFCFLNWIYLEKFNNKQDFDCLYSNILQQKTF